MRLIKRSLHELPYTENVKSVINILTPAEKRTRTTPTTFAFPTTAYSGVYSIIFGWFHNHLLEAKIFSDGIAHI